MNSRVFELISMEEEFEEIQPQENAERIYKNRSNYLEDMDEDNFRKSRISKQLLSKTESGSFLITVTDFYGLSISSAGRPDASLSSEFIKFDSIKFRLENKEFKNTYILGDSGYKVCDYMMKPLLNPITNCEMSYNECFGVWKRRFPVLSMGMRIAVNTAMTVIVACAVFHNISTQRKEPLPLEEHPDISNEIIENDNEVHENAKNRNSNARTILINSYFAR
ncbi:hypothetical protein CVS40_12871 [Lucilia cuprina]|nr:hypothetical protein CVS40_12871 [Lucilia cuprina]